MRVSEAIVFMKLRKVEKRVIDDLYMMLCAAGTTVTTEFMESCFEQALHRWQEQHPGQDLEDPTDGIVDEDEKTERVKAFMMKQLGNGRR